MNKRTAFAIVLGIFIIYIVSAATHSETNIANNETIEAIENNTNINDTSKLVGALDDTNETPSGPVSIPLEKPPFID